MLDVGCGYGRHALHLAQRGCSVTGVDASPEMLARAKEAAKRHSLSMRFVEADMREMRFVEADMREMRFDEPFDAAYFMGGAFGIFGDAGDMETLRAAGQALRPERRLLIDVPNACTDIARLVQQGGTLRDWSEEDGQVRLVEATLDVTTCMGRFRKTLIGEEVRQERYQEFRSYLYPELKRMLSEAGFTITGDYGDYGSSALTLCSPRMIVVGERQRQTV